MEPTSAFERNCQPIAEVLERYRPETGIVLEIASGLGDHAVFFARRFGQLRWQPSEGDDRLLEVIGERVSEARLPNLSPPLAIDAKAPRWPCEGADLLININMIHISPWAACLGLFAGAARVLDKGGLLYLYGPFTVGKRHTSQSNRQFDAMLRGRDPLWGVRDVGDVTDVARDRGFEAVDSVEMPANNLSLIYRRC